MKPNTCIQKTTAIVEFCNLLHNVENNCQVKQLYILLSSIQATYSNTAEMSKQRVQRIQTNTPDTYVSYCKLQTKCKITTECQDSIKYRITRMVQITIIVDCKPFYTEFQQLKHLHILNTQLLHYKSFCSQ